MVLTAQRDEDRAALDALGHGAGAVELSMENWDALALDEQRALVRVAVERVTVAHGRGLPIERKVSVELRGQ